MISSSTSNQPFFFVPHPLLPPCSSSSSSSSFSAFTPSLRPRHFSLAPNSATTFTTTMSASSPPPASSWEEYAKKRNSGQYQGGSLNEVQKDLMEFVTRGDMDFDGGDSGGGVVGDGNYDLEDQHNTTGMLRGGFAELSVDNVRINTSDNQTAPGAKVTVKGSSTPVRVTGATSARIASAGRNYFGRSTGYADEKIRSITDDQRRNNQMDEVRAQQLENWFNQRESHATNQARGQGNLFNVARETTIISATPSSSPSVPGQRLDGKEWGPVFVGPADPIQHTYELQTSINNTTAVSIKVQNQFCTFAPFRCAFTPDSHRDFKVDPPAGTMNRNTGQPTEITVRFNPQQLGSGATATLVFETEDFKHVYKFIGRT